MKVKVNFFSQQILKENIPKDFVFHHLLLSGQASFHDAFIPHLSTQNNSEKQRCAWIVRYIPRYTKFVQNDRNDFHNHQLMDAN